MDGFVDRLHALRFLRACDPSYRALTFPLVGLPPTEHLSLSWTYHAIAITPAGPMELVRSSLSIVSGLPRETVRSAPAIVVSGPAQRSLTLWPARSPSRLTTLSIESSDSFVASAAVSIATGWNEPVPGRELHPLKSSAFSRRTVSPTNRACDFRCRQGPDRQGWQGQRFRNREFAAKITA
jgi:hypothetical protein